MSEDEWGNYRDREKLYLTSAPARRKVDPSKSAKKPGTVTRMLDTTSLDSRISKECRAKGGVTHKRDNVKYCTNPNIDCISQRDYDGTGKPCGEKLK